MSFLGVLILGVEEPGSLVGVTCLSGLGLCFRFLVEEGILNFSGEGKEGLFSSSNKSFDVSHSVCR